MAAAGVDRHTVYPCRQVVIVSVQVYLAPQAEQDYPIEVLIQIVVQWIVCPTEVCNRTVVLLYQLSELRFRLFPSFRHDNTFCAFSVPYNTCCTRFVTLFDKIISGGCRNAFSPWGCTFLFFFVGPAARTAHRRCFSRGRSLSWIAVSPRVAFYF